MTHDDARRRMEYPDTAGYPDGMGFLDEGTAAAADPLLLAAAAELGVPRTERENEFAVREDVGNSLYEAVVADQRIGWVGYERADDRRILTVFSVEPAFRDRGIGSALLAHVLDDLRDRGLTITVGHPAIVEFLTVYAFYRDLIDSRHPGLRVA